MKTLETENGRFGKFRTWFGNITALPTEWIIPIFAMSLVYKLPKWVYDPEHGFPRLLPVWKVGHIGLGNYENDSLYYNSGFYFRFMLPFWIGVQIRWSGKDPTKREVFCTGFGWKLNGRLGALFRFQSDDSSERGVNGPNLGQGKGWEYGPR